MKSIDLNCDLGEGVGDDQPLMALISSASIACGGHAGDEHTMRVAVESAVRYRVAVGAHPSYPDRAGFGRVELHISPEQLRHSVREQVINLHRVCAEVGVALRHVKPHGALYNAACRDSTIAAAVVEAVTSVNRDLMLFGLPGSKLVVLAQELGLTVAAEGFADRRYMGDGTLAPRHIDGAVISDPQEAAEQAAQIVLNQRAATVGGGWVEVQVDTICVHGDAPGAVERLRAVRSALEQAGVEIAIAKRPGS
jgi:UPF0271 protein